MRENIKNVGLILALVIAGVSLPTSIISIMNKPTTPITETNNYYYNTTIVTGKNNWENRKNNWEKIGKIIEIDQKNYW